ncbi:unnamed protein product [Chilo suppressalis]|uniref:Peptidase S1 domain-containing protein n=1 Tax=Chilo suppressalis TaxID=168631 RepID=A0ABN8AVD9_CHISP|nr:hypothetical protein evm_008601 [Chilo suppressalis]CAH0400084.1 unnamed protein product [Chilo suppressalis]
MKSLALLLVAAAFAQASVLPQTNAYGYLKNSIALGEKLRTREEQFLNQRIVGGVPATHAQVPYQAGLIIDIIGLEGRGVCGGSLVSANRVITAAHCWSDGVHQGWRLTVVLGSTLLFSGGQRIETSVIAMHTNWIPILVRNDVAVIYLPSNVQFSNTISPVALPSASLLNEDFAGERATASGFGLTSDGAGISTGQFLSIVNLNVIRNSVCRASFPLFVHESNICTSGVGGVGTCQGDSGGPLVVSRDNQQILIGITSFGSPLGCESIMPAAYARVTSFIAFFNQHIQSN